MLSLENFVYSVDMWKHSSVGMSRDFIIYTVDDVCLKLYTIFSKCNLIAGSTLIKVTAYA